MMNKEQFKRLTLLILLGKENPKAVLNLFCPGN